MGANSQVDRRSSLQPFTSIVSLSKPGFFKKLLRRRSTQDSVISKDGIASAASHPAVPRVPADGEFHDALNYSWSRPSEDTSAGSPLINNLNSDRLTPPKNMRGHHSRQRSLDTYTSSLRQGPNAIDDGTESVWDFYNEIEDTLTLEPSSTSTLSLQSRLSHDSCNSGITLDEADASDLSFAEAESEALRAPRYIRVVKKNRHSPDAFDKLFLAQTLNEPFGSSGREKLVVPLRILPSPSRHSLNEHMGSDSTEIDEEGELQKRRQQNEILLMEFSPDGKYLATAGRDCTIKIWKIISSLLARMEIRKGAILEKRRKTRSSKAPFEQAAVFYSAPLIVLRGHTLAVLALNWSKNNFLILGSMDRTAKLWQIDNPHCLKSFHHDEFVTLVKFHLTDDRFFLSGSLDNRLRLWSILENSVAYESYLGENFLITALGVTPDGSLCMAGGFNGSIAVFDTNGFHPRATFEINTPHAFHAKSKPNKVTGIKLFINEAAKDATNNLDKWTALITTNDSKIRLINTYKKRLVTRFKGVANTDSSIVADISDDRRFVISGSEDHRVLVWENNNEVINSKLKSSLKKLSHGAKLDLLIFNRYMKYIHKKFLSDAKSQNPEFEYVSNENSSHSSFHAHHSKVNAAIFAPEATKILLKQSNDEIYDLLKRDPLLLHESDKDDSLSPKPSHRKDSLASPSEGEGTIVITTDQYGLIKVFRQDKAFQARKRLRSARRRRVTVSRSLLRPSSSSASNEISSGGPPTPNLLEFPSTGTRKLLSRVHSGVSVQRPLSRSFSNANSAFEAPPMLLTPSISRSNSTAAPHARIVPSSSMMRLDYHSPLAGTFDSKVHGKKHNDTNDAGKHDLLANSGKLKMPVIHSSVYLNSTESFFDPVEDVRLLRNGLKG